MANTNGLGRRVARFAYALAILAAAFQPTPGALSSRTRLPIGAGEAWAYYDGQTPDPSWISPSFGGFGWRTGRGGVPGSGTVRTLYLRRTFDVPDPREVGAVRFSILSEGRFVAYLNGVEIARGLGADIVTVRSAPIARGANVVAIQVEGTVGRDGFSPVATLEAIPPSAESPTITNLSPVDGADDVSWVPQLCVQVADADSDVAGMTVTFHGAAVPGQEVVLGTAQPVDGVACLAWPARPASTDHAWHASTTDGLNDTVGASSTFATSAVCTLDSECDDANICTSDTCNAGTCAHAPVGAGTTTCGLGVCQNTIQTCVDGVLQVCTPGAPYATSDSSCNNSDDDCDGAVDDDYVQTPSSCGLGACHRTGMITCQAGHEVDTCQPGPPLAATDVTCDLVDDDCDGPVDEDIVRVTTTCGIGVCSAEGSRSCENGVWVDTCVPRPPILPSDTNCNNIDSDCDGQIDEDYVPTPSSCGLGACHRTGMITCQAGYEVDSCTPGPPLAATDITCDLIDDDCDGPADEDIVRVTTTCGVGVCAAEGSRTCENGVWVDTCVPRPPILPTDTNCNNVDSDCDGQIDEDYVPTVSTCGTGACRRTGMITCQAGHEVDSCVPGTPLSATDVTCDLVDDDCDGAVDDDIVRVTTTCGVGVCSAEGSRTCENGVWVDTCVPRPPILPSDTNCNNVDSDCDGQVDEDYVPTVSTCGSGACARVGTVTCQAGHEVDSCLPGTPAAEICNGIDDDCDGVIDNGGAALCNDGDTCNGAETCGGAQGCLAGDPIGAAVEISIPRDVTGVPGGTIAIPVQATPASGIEIDLSIAYDPAILHATGVTTTTITAGAVLTFDLSVPGEVGLRVATPDPQQTFFGSGPIVMIQFQVLGTPGPSSAIDVTRAVINEGAIGTCVHDGRVATCATGPGEISGLTVSGSPATTVAWTAAPAGVDYDAATGSLSTLRGDRSVIGATCFASHTAGTSVIDNRPLSPGEGYYYLVRGHQSCGVGTLGSGSAGEAREPLAACP